MHKYRKKILGFTSEINYDNIIYILCYILFSVAILTLLVLPFVKLNYHTDEKNAEAKKASDRDMSYITTKSDCKIPLNGNITSKYGWRVDPVYTSTGKYGFHEGIDISASKSNKICAYRDGTVSSTGYSDTYGYYIIVFHGDHESFYAHCEKINVTSGQNVSCGENIAIAGSTGRTTGKHLHFEIRVNGTAVDPMKYIK